MKLTPFAKPLLLALLATPHAAAQAGLTLPRAVSRALNSNANVVSARANLQKTQANLRSVRADPSTVVTTQTQAEQEVSAQAALLDDAKRSTTQSVIQAYTSSYETALRVNQAAAQVALDERNLAIAQARLKNRTATALDVSRAQTALGSSRQTLADARASLPVQEATLARLIGLSAGTDLKLSAPPTPPKLSQSLAALQAGLEKRLPALVQAANGAAFAQLQVNIANNDYTPARTLEDARTALANAQRSLNDAQRAANTGVRDAYRAVQSASDSLSVAQAQAKNAQDSLALARARLKAGTAAAIEVQQAEVQAAQAQLGVVQARDGMWLALAALSKASGIDVTGLQ